MPNYFQLTRKSDPEAGPVSLNQIDEELCAAFGFDPDPEWYVFGWFDSIGGRLASGSSWDDCRACFREQVADAERRGDADYAALMNKLVEVADWLEERFTANTGYVTSAAARSLP